jgi:hypothetical protein
MFLLSTFISGVEEALVFDGEAIEDTLVFLVSSSKFVAGNRNMFIIASQLGHHIANIQLFVLIHSNQSSIL